MKRLTLLLTVTLVVCLAGCKVRIQVPDGGSVISRSDAYGCSTGDTCDVEVVDVHFDETFVAVPDVGFRFDRWKSIERGLCGGSSEVCRLRTAGFDEEEALLRFLESPDEIFFLEPVFKPLIVDAFDPALFENVTFSLVVQGLSQKYRFKGDGTYSASSPPLFASGEWEFRSGNKVIFCSRLANTNTDDLIGFAVFDGFSVSENAYIVCFIDDQSVQSVARAIEVCENRSSNGIGVKVFYKIQV